MAYYVQKMENVNNGMIKFAPIGFSWTTLFFGFFVPLIRGDFIWFLIMLVFGLFFNWIAFIVFAFFYNGVYYNGLIKRGFVPVDARQNVNNVVTIVNSQSVN